MGILDVILIINIVLKLLNLITWSWWAVLWPLWAELIIIIIFWLKAWLDN